MEVAGVTLAVVALGPPIIKLAKTIRRRRYKIVKGFHKSADKLIDSITLIQVHCESLSKVSKELPVEDAAGFTKLLTDIQGKLGDITTSLQETTPQGEKLSQSDYSKIKDALSVATSQASICEKQLKQGLELQALKSQARQRFSLDKVEADVGSVQADQTATLMGVEALHSKAEMIHVSIQDLAKSLNQASCVVHVGLLGHWLGTFERYDLTVLSTIADIIKLELERRTSLPHAPLHFFAVYPRSNRCTAEGLSWVRCENTELIGSIQRKSMDRQGHSHPIRVEYTPQSRPFSVMSVFGSGIEQHAVTIDVPVIEPFNLNEALKSLVMWPSDIDELQVLKKIDAETGRFLDDLGALLQQYLTPFRFRLCLEVQVTPPISELIAF